MARGYDEPFTLYGLVARRVATDDARTYVTFELDPAARFSDGKPITPEDVLFSWQLLRDKGRPNHRIYYSKVTKAEAIGSNAVRFDLPGDDRELPLILGLMPVLPKHAIDPETFEETTVRPMIGSGPYVIGKVDPGRSLTLMRNPNYWGTRPRRSIAASGISTRSATTSIAIRTRCSKPSSAACSTSARRPIRRAGSRATTSPRCATDWSSRRR